MSPAANIGVNAPPGPAPATDSIRLKRWQTVLLILGTVVYLAVAAAVARSRAPFIDEAWYSMPAWNLAFNGSMGTPVIEPSASPMPGMNVSLTGIRQHTYWLMPLPIVLEAAWFRAAGFSIVTMRQFSTLWAVLVLGAWYFLLRRLSGSAGIALAGILLIAFDETFLLRAAFGRMEMMSAALGFWGIEIYLRQREASLSRALFFGNLLVAAAGLSHPNGGLLALPALMFLVIRLDRRRLRFSSLLPVALAYALCAGGMAVYILQDPSAFRAQFFGNSGGRLSALTHPLTILPREMMRYLNIYGLGANTSGISRIKGVVLAVYAVSLLFIFLRPALRRRYATFGVLALIYIAGLAVIENYKVEWYVVYTIPFLAASAALVAGSVTSRAGRVTTVMLLSGMIVLQAGGVYRVIRRNTYGTSYVPAIQTLKTLSSKNTIVAGGSELGFGYGFNDHLDDDLRLGLNSGKRPDLVVMDERYKTALLAFRKTEPATAAYIDGYLKSSCTPGQTSLDYTIYVCRPAASAPLISR
jgi:hypothetical protein